MFGLAMEMVESLSLEVFKERLDLSECPVV